MCAGAACLLQNNQHTRLAFFFIILSRYISKIKNPTKKKFSDEHRTSSPHNPSQYSKTPLQETQQKMIPHFCFPHRLKLFWDLPGHNINISLYYGHDFILLPIPASADGHQPHRGVKTHIPRLVRIGVSLFAIITESHPTIFFLI